MKILFVCHGNICRSPMAEFVLKDLVKNKSYKDKVVISSLATHDEEEGNDIYPPVKRLLTEKGIAFNKREAKVITSFDGQKYDYIFIMDKENEYMLQRMLRKEDQKKVYYLLKYSSKYQNIEVADPWYTRDFNKTYEQIKDSCIGIINSIIEPSLL